MEVFGFHLRNETVLRTLTEDVLKTSEIEGELLNREEVRSSVARKLGLVPSDRFVDGVVEMMLDATRNFNDRLNANRLFAWHSALFPTGRSGIHKITVGNWRKAGKGPMQVVSGPMGKEKVHFETPPSENVPSLMKVFLAWFNKVNNLDPVLKSALAHLWFVTVHPFDDGNGRIARALGDMLLARADGGSRRFYSMSSEIRNDRKNYYAILEKTQKGNLDVTEWLLWYLNCLNNALNTTDKAFQKVLLKTKFWDLHHNTELNERQRAMINKLFDAFEGKLNSSKWAKIMKCSTDTALRDITDLLQKDILEKEESGGRSTSYVLKFKSD